MGSRPDMPYANIEDKRARDRERYHERRDAFMADKACVTCESTDQLEVHHRVPALKVDHRVWSWAEPRRRAELRKVSVLCKPCHEAVTVSFRQRGLEA